MAVNKIRNSIYQVKQKLRNVNRREFLKIVAATGIGAALGSFFTSYTIPTIPQKEEEENIYMVVYAIRDVDGITKNMDKSMYLLEDLGEIYKSYMKSAIVSFPGTGYKDLLSSFARGFNKEIYIMLEHVDSPVINIEETREEIKNVIGFVVLDVIGKYWNDADLLRRFVENNAEKGYKIMLDVNPEFIDELSPLFRYINDRKLNSKITITPLLPHYHISDKYSKSEEFYIRQLDNNENVYKYAKKFNIDFIPSFMFSHNGIPFNYVEAKKYGDNLLRKFEKVIIYSADEPTNGTALFSGLLYKLYQKEGES